MYALLIAMATLVPSPQPRIVWSTFEAGGYTLCAPVVDRCKDPIRCITLPPGTLIGIPSTTTEPDPEEEKRKS